MEKYRIECELPSFFFPVSHPPSSSPLAHLRLCKVETGHGPHYSVVALYEGEFLQEFTGWLGHLFSGHLKGDSVKTYESRMFEIMKINNEFQTAKERRPSALQRSSLAWARC